MSFNVADRHTTAARSYTAFAAILKKISLPSNENAIETLAHHADSATGKSNARTWGQSFGTGDNE